MADIPQSVGSAQYVRRPIVVVQNNNLNNTSTNIEVVAVTSVIKKPGAPYHVVLPAKFGLSLESMALCEQIIPLDRGLFRTKLGSIPSEYMKQIDRAVHWTVNSKRNRQKRKRYRPGQKRNTKVLLNNIRNSKESSVSLSKSQNGGKRY